MIQIVINCIIKEKPKITGLNRELPVNWWSKKNDVSFFSFQLNAKKRFVVSHMVRLWWHAMAQSNMSHLKRITF
jgi:hypothetical protein